MKVFRVTVIYWDQDQFRDDSDIWYFEALTEVGAALLAHERAMERKYPVGGFRIARIESI